MPTISEADTPLNRLLVARGITQGALAKATGIGQASISRLANGRTKDAGLAERIVDYLDPKRATFNELLVLYPDRYPRWRPVDAKAG